MANLVATETLDEVKRLDKADPVLGYDPANPGAGVGVANLPTQALLNRTEWLKNRIGIQGTWDLSGTPVLPNGAAQFKMYEVIGDGSWGGTNADVGDIVMLVNGTTNIKVFLSSANVSTLISNSMTAHVGAADPHNQYVLETMVGAPNGVAPLDGNSKIPAANLPSYVDDVLMFADFASFPVTGETGIIYVAEDTGVCYRWTGASYLKISDDDVLQYANLAAFPVSGAAGTLYIAADTGLLYRWDGSAYAAVGGNSTPTITADTTLNVPASYSTINAALAYAMSAVVLNGAEIVIAVDGTTYTCNEQITLNNLDIPHITIKATSPVSVDTTGFVVNTPFGQPAFMFLQNCNLVLDGMWNRTAGSPCLGMVLAGCNITFGNLTYTASGLTGFVYNLYVYGGDFLGLGLNCSGSPANADVKFEAAFVYVDRLTVTSGSGVIPLDVNGSTVKLTSTGQTLTATNTPCVAIANSTFHLDATNLVTGNTNHAITADNSNVTIKNTNLTHDCTGTLLFFTDSDATVSVNTTATASNSHTFLLSDNSTVRLQAYTNGAANSGIPLRVQNGGIIQVKDYPQLTPRYTGALLTPLNMPTGSGLILAGQAGWTPLTLDNSWAAIGGWQTPAFKIEGNTLWIKFALESGTALGIATLPAGARPAEKHSLWVNIHDNTNAPAFGHLVVNTDGTIVLEHPGAISGHKVFCTASIPLE